MTGTEIWRATRSAVRCRVPVSFVGMSGSGTRCTLARATRAVGGEDDRAVHLGQLRQALRRELGVEQEPAGADVQDGGPVADDDERAHLRLQDAVDALPQRSAGGHEPQRGVENFRSALRQQILPVGTGSEATPRRRSPRPAPRRRSATRRSVMPGRRAWRRARSRRGTRAAAPRPAGAAPGAPGGSRRRGRSPRRRSCRRRRRVVAGARDRERDREVGRGFGDPHAARDAGVDVLVGERDAGALLQHRDEHREPVPLEGLRDPPRDRRAGRRDERLHLDAQRPRPLHHRGHHRTRSRRRGGRRGRARSDR